VSLRLRLTLWYAGLTSLIVLSIALLAYVAHGRTQYLDVDRALVEEAGYLAPAVELAAAPETFAAEPATPDQFQTFVRLYDAEGRASSAGTATAPPPLDALATLQANAGPAYDAPLQWLPGGEVSAPGAFATVRSGDQRIRLYAQPVTDSSGTLGYVQTWTSLQGIDRSIARFRLLIFGGAILAAAAVWTGGLAISGLALRPVRSMTRTASAISQSGQFDRRVEEPDRRDELQRLAVVFNEMLDALEASYRTQQRFVADAAHELRAPLTVIRGNIELLARVQDMSQADRDEALAHLQQEATRLSRLVDELMTLAHSDAGLRLEMQPVELDSVLLQVVAQRSASDPERVTVARLEPVVVEGNADRLHQLAAILLDNALKYSAPEDPPVEVSAYRDAATATLEVRDHGIGIPDDAIPHIFERFYRADRARGRDPGGSGLGLSIAQWIANQHHAAIEVDSNLGAGTSIRVRFHALAPTDAPTPPPAEPRAAAPTEPAGTSAGQPAATSHTR
jgi:two-component system OmpR family sensor kinase